MHDDQSNRLFTVLPFNIITMFHFILYQATWPMKHTENTETMTQTDSYTTELSKVYAEKEDILMNYVFSVTPTITPCTIITEVV